MARRSARRYYTNPRPSPKSSGMSDGAKLALALGGIAAVAGIGYLIYQNQSSSTASSGSGGSTTSPSYPTTLGPGGSNVPLATTQSGSADQTGNQFETGPGANDPLVPTGA